ncbi:MAG: hypothetical protein PHS04_07045 [Tissierellia bacterium]|nr:hypothetical protein [Tissierellia bacterium]
MSTFNKILVPVVGSSALKKLQIKLLKLLRNMTVKLYLLQLQ